METPVAFLIFNRPEVTERVFAAIAQARPRRLLVVADGPRAGKPGEAEKCAAARAVVARVDWPCEVLTNFAENNLGCKQRVASGLTWVFGQVEEAIIVEDDCLPHPDFFRFCTEMLARYREDERVALVCGSNFMHGQQFTPHSYYFGHYGHIWGWASWRRAWAAYDVTMQRWPALRATDWLWNTLRDQHAVKHWADCFDKTHEGAIDTWDYQWLFAWWSRGQMAVVPQVNLISNLGCDAGATHTKDFTDTASALPVAPLAWPLRHPPAVECHEAADKFTFTQFCPWAIPQPGARAWLREHLAPHFPPRLRRLLTRRKR
jgi:hypothetical protein